MDADLSGTASVFTPIDTLNKNQPQTRQTNMITAKKRTHLQLSPYRFWWLLFLFGRNIQAQSVQNQESSAHPQEETGKTAVCPPDLLEETQTYAHLQWQQEQLDRKP